MSTFADPHSLRPWHLLEIATFEDAGGIAMPASAFVLLVAGDTSALSGPRLVQVCSQLLRAGARYACCLGPGADRLESAFDEAGIDVYQDAEGVIMTTSHSKETLEAATWFAVNSAFPDPAYRDGEQAVVALAIGASVGADVRDYLAKGAPIPVNSRTHR